MAVYVITGKLGGGKSIMSVAKVREYLQENRIVATNIDLRLHWLINKDAKKCRVMRVPDKPTIADLENIGIGNPLIHRGIKDESMNGLLLLDECGTWFNSRDWNDKGRKELINWIVHARKKGWDIGFIIQDLSVLDKQARVMFAEHVVYCKRTDRMSVPLVGWIYKAITGNRLTLPKMHMGIVKYGTDRNSMVVDRWRCFGSSLYNAYNTSQVFTNDYPHGVYSYLPPYHTHYRYRVKFGVKNIMRITKIYFKKYSKMFCYSAGCISAAIFFTVTAPEVEQIEKIPTSTYAQYKITGFYKMPNQPKQYQLENGDGEKITSIELQKLGFNVTEVNPCVLKISNGSSESVLKCG